MKLVIQNEQVVVYDDVLMAEDLATLRRYVAIESYTSPLISSGWVRAWRPTDGQPFCRKLYTTAGEPLGNALDLLTGPARETATPARSTSTYILIGARRGKRESRLWSYHL